MLADCSTPAAPRRIASNCNPGSSYTTSMPFCIALAVREMSMTIDEAIWAATAGGAAALRRIDIGILAVGARADLIILDTANPIDFVYRPGVPLIASTIIGGQTVDHSAGPTDRHSKIFETDRRCGA